MKPALAKFKFNEELSQGKYKADSVRFAYSLMMNTHTKESKEGINPEVSSFLQDNILNKALRDVVLDIGRETPTFNMMKVIKNLKNFDDYLDTGTSLSNEELNRCFQQNAYTRQVKSVKWPENQNLITLTNNKSSINEPMIQKAIEKQSNNSDTHLVERTVRTSIHDLSWLLKDKKNFIAFIQLLEGRPNKVYCS